MSLLKFVCPYSQELLNRLKGKDLAIRIDNPADVATASADVAKSGNQLFCIIIDFKTTLDEIDFLEDWCGIPIALYAPELGKFRNLVKRLELLRKLNIRIYFPVSNKNNLTELQILASLGIHCCAVFGEQHPDWEALSDLMTYAILGSLPHASIEPFTYIAEHYDPLRYTEWGTVYFDDPRNFLHLDNQGRIAVSRKELIMGNFMSDDITKIGDPVSCPEYVKRLSNWRQYFVDNHACTHCMGWRVCLGKFTTIGESSAGCAAFLSEMMEVVEQYQNQKTQQQAMSVWQL